MYDDGQELDEDEGQVTGMMHATVISDDGDDDMGEGGIEVMNPHG